MTADDTARADIVALQGQMQVVTRFLSEQFPDEWGKPPADVCPCEMEWNGNRGPDPYCTQCGGTGGRTWNPMTRPQFSQCDDCGGTGEIPAGPGWVAGYCTQCGGTGRAYEATDEQVNAAIVAFAGAATASGTITDIRHAMRAALEAAAARQEKP